MNRTKIIIAVALLVFITPFTAIAQEGILLKEIEYKIVYENYKGHNYTHTDSFRLSKNLVMKRDAKLKIVEKLIAPSEKKLSSFMGKENFTEFKKSLINLLYYQFGFKPCDITDPIVLLIAGLFMAILNICTILTGHNGFTEMIGTTICFITFVILALPIVITSGLNIASWTFYNSFGEPDYQGLLETFGIIFGLPLILAIGSVYLISILSYCIIMCVPFGISNIIEVWNEAFTYAYNMVFGNKNTAPYPLDNITIYSKPTYYKLIG